MRKRTAAALLCAAGAAALGASCVPRTVRYDVWADLPAAFDGLRIAHLSDLHGRRFGKDGRFLVEAVRRARPDLAVFTGDLEELPPEEDPRAYRLLHALAAELTVLYVPGNHEQRQTPARYARILEAVRRAGAVCLCNERYTLRRAGASLPFYGLELPLRYYHAQYDAESRASYFSASRLAAVFPPPQGFCVLLAHDPLFFPAYARWGAGLVLAGHMHGGAVALGGAQGGLLWAEGEFLPRFGGGRYRLGRAQMVVSRGLGGKPALRFGLPPELPVITLRKEPSHGSPANH